MAIPTVTGTIQDPGLGLVNITPTIPVFVGPSSGGTKNTVVPVTRLGGLAQFGYGPLTQAAGHCLAVAGGPVYCISANATAAGSNSEVNQTGEGESITLGGNPYMDYQGLLEITATGEAGAGKFRFSLDGGKTFSSELTIPPGQEYLCPAGDVTISFGNGSFTAGDTFEWTSSAPSMNGSDLTAAINALEASGVVFDYIVVCHRPASASAGATLFSSLSALLAGLATRYRYTLAMMHSGVESSMSTVVTAHADLADWRIHDNPVDARLPDARPIMGYANPMMPSIYSLAARAKASALSENLGRVKSGPLVGLSEPSHDEAEDQVLNVAKLGSVRSHFGKPGFYATEGVVKSPNGSDFDVWEKGRVMNTACRTVVGVLQNQINENFATLADGTGRIDPLEKVTLEKELFSALRAVLLDTTSAKGTKGQVSAVSAVVDGETNFLSTQRVDVDISVVPLGRARELHFTIGYTAGESSEAAAGGEQ